MSRLFFLSIFLFTAGSLFGQVSHATIAATIVTPVGTEISGDINDMIFFRKDSKIKSLAGNIKIQNEKQIPFLKIIGEVFSHHVTVENDYVLLKRKKENEGMLPARKPESVVNITVNFD